MIRKTLFLLTVILLSISENMVALPAPTLQGKLIYHSYTSYDALDSKIYLYDFANNQLSCISGNWNIIAPMNAHFSPDGKQITFMGINPSTDSWSIYLYELDSPQQPVRLSAGNSRDEDPKFSPDGKRITFKRNDRVSEMDVATGNVTVITPAGASYSMPYYNPEGDKLVCSKDGGQNSSICLIDIHTKAISVLYDKTGVQDYYPIGADENSFYYTTGYSTSNRSDQVYRGYWNGQPSVSLAFNRSTGDYSDAYPVDDQWVIISSTRYGSRGGYDLYIANAETGDIYSITNYNSGINTTQEELGATYYDPVRETNLPAIKTNDLIAYSTNQVVTVTGEFDEVSIYDIAGQKLQCEKVKNHFVSQPLNTGIYFIRTDKQSGKIIVR